MSKFCVNCGTPLEDGATFCFNCKKNPDAIQTDQQQQEQLAKAKQKGKTKKIIIAVVLAVVALAGVITFFCVRNTPTSVVKRYLSAHRRCDYKTELALSYEAHFDKEKSYSEYKEDAKEYYDKLKEDGDLNDLKADRKEVTYKVVSVHKYSKDELEDLKDELSENYKDTDKITKAASVKIRAKNEDDSWKYSIICVKCKGKWYRTGASIIG